MAIVFPTLSVGDGLGHPGGGAPAFFGGLVQVVVGQVLAALEQELAGLLTVVGDGYSRTAEGSMGEYWVIGRSRWS